MTTVSQPLVTSSILPASAVAPNVSQKILLVGQGNGGTVSGGALVENLPLDLTVIDTLVGEDSMLAQMYRAIREINEVSRVDAIVLDDDGGAVDATGDVTFTGTATASGSIVIVIGSQFNRTYSVTVADTDTATVVGDSLEALIAADTDAPFTAANVAGVVTITAVNGGTLGNSLGISASASLTVPGISNTITAMTSGAGDPNTDDIFDVIGDTRYQAVVWPYFANTSELRTLLDARFNADNKVLDGVGFTSSVDTLGNHLTRLNALNSQSLVDFADKTTDETLFKGPAQLEYPPVKAAQFAAIRALRLTDGVSLGQFVLAANGPSDAFGGPALASKPYFNTPTPQLPLVGTGRGWIDGEIQQLFDAGGSVMGNNVDGNGTLVGEVVTSYKTDPASNTDNSFKFLNTVDTMSGIREYYFNNLRKRFAQSRLTEGDLIQGRDIANALTIASFCSVLYQDLSGTNFVLTELGEDALNFFKGNLTVTIDKQLGRATIVSRVLIVSQFREIFQTIQLAFSPEG